MRLFLVVINALSVWKGIVLTPVNFHYVGTLLTVSVEKAPVNAIFSNRGPIRKLNQRNLTLV